MVEVLVTGGAGFIGSNFVRHALEAHPDWHITTLDKLTYAGRMETLKDVIEHPRHRFVQGDIADAQVAAPLVKASNIVVNFAAETHVDRSILEAGEFIKTDIIGTFVLLEAARTAPALRALRADFDRRGLRKRRGGVERRDRRTAAAKPVLGEQGRRRSPRLQLLGHIRRSRDDYESIEQLRAVPVPGESDSALHHQRDRQHPGAALWCGPEHSRLDARDGSLPRDRRGDRARKGRRGLQHRRRQRSAQCRSHLHAASARGATRLAHQESAGSAGARSALQPRHREAPRARLAASGSIRARAGRHRSLVPRKRVVVAPHQRQRSRVPRVLPDSNTAREREQGPRDRRPRIRRALPGRTPGDRRR